MLAAGGGGSGGGSMGLKGTGGGGDDDSSGQPSKGSRFSWPGWEARVAADPQFIYKVFVEQVIGVAAAVIGDMSGRPHWGLYELDFVFSTLVVGSILNFSLMYLLAPAAAVPGSAAASGLVSKIFSESTLQSWGAPGGHMFEPGAYSLSRRLLNLAYKGGVFGVVGLGAGIVGTCVSNGLIAVRKALDPAFEPQNSLPNVPLNAACWATHMGVSSNIRYQMINGFEMALQPRLPPLAFRMLSSGVRTGNNILGGMSFVLLAKVLGVQQSKGDEILEMEAEEAEAAS